MNPRQSQARADSLRTGQPLTGDLCQAPQVDRSRLAPGVGWPDLNPEQKLGHLWEDVWGRVLSQSPAFQLIAQHLQIFSADRTTLGELDFVLFETGPDRYLHLEVAVKFYLAIQIDGTWQYPGPDPRDHWERKLARMESHQFRLAQSPEARALLRLRWNIDHIEPRQLLHGILFSPIDTPSAPLPRAISPACRQGIWLYQKQWDTYFNQVERVCHIPKYLWPADITSELRDDLGLIEASELKARAGPRCALFTLPDSPVPHCLVPDNWPHAAPSSSG